MHKMMVNINFIPHEELDSEPGHVNHFNDGKDPKVTKNFVFTLFKHRQSVQSENDCGDKNARDGKHCNDPSTD